MKTKLSKNAPIGIFDSGLGGLTVLKSLIKILPNESFIYFGDTAHVPYGTKSEDTIIKYSRNIMEFFAQHKTKSVVIACNTASAISYNYLKKEYSIPLFDVVTPSVEFAIKTSKTKIIGIIGTTSTINSKAYSKKFKKINTQFSIFEVSCPLFVPVIEEGLSDTSIAKNIAKLYLDKLNNKNIDTLILGCTHYPIMAKTIKSIIPSNIKMVFSGVTVGQKLENYLKKNSLINNSSGLKNIKFYVTDLPQKFDEIGSRFFGKKLHNVNHVNLKQ